MREEDVEEDDYVRVGDGCRVRQRKEATESLEEKD